MHKFFAFALVVVVLLALGLGAVGSFTAGVRQAWGSPEVVHELARQEGAKAEKLYAEAAQAQAQADKAKAQAEAAGAWSRSSQLLAIEAGRRWPLVVSLVLVVVSIFSLGAAGAWVRWAISKSAVVPMPGGLVALRQGRALVVVDPARMIGGVLQLEGGQVLPVLQTSEDLAADIARAALVTTAVQNVGGSESRAELVARVTEHLSTAFSNLAGAASMPREMIASGAPALRLVPLRTPAQKKQAAVDLDTLELQEFVKVGAKIGFQRKAWASRKFESTGRACSQTRWAILAQSLREVDLLDGPALVCPVEEAMQRLGFQPESEGKE